MTNLNHTLTIAIEAALLAGERIKQGFAEPITYKSKGDISDRVTQTDFDCQNIIQEKLASEFPDIAFFGEEEESGISNQELNSSDKFLIPNSSSLRWIVDPLDGTMNFTHRLPFCGVSIALEEHGECIVGVLHFPMLGWPASSSPVKAGEGWTYTAVKGKGAKKNDQPIHVSDCEKFEDAIITEIYSDREARGKMALYPPVAAFRKFGSAITSIALCAEGAVDGVALRCRKWDTAAGEVILREAGAKVKVIMEKPEDPRSTVTCIAATPKVFEGLEKFVSKYRKN